jgi:hypothetical protein
MIMNKADKKIYEAEFGKIKKTEASPFSDELDGLVDLLRDAITIMDEKGRSIPNHTKGLWDDQWDEMRLKVYKAYETLSEKAD